MHIGCSRAIPGLRRHVTALSVAATGRYGHMITRVSVSAFLDRVLLTRASARLTRSWKFSFARNAAACFVGADSSSEQMGAGASPSIFGLRHQKRSRPFQ